MVMLLARFKCEMIGVMYPSLVCALYAKANVERGTYTSQECLCCPFE